MALDTSHLIYLSNGDVTSSNPSPFSYMFSRTTPQFRASYRYEAVPQCVLQEVNCMALDTSHIIYLSNGEMTSSNPLPLRLQGQPHYDSVQTLLCSEAVPQSALQEV